jgi:predicted alpha/beta-hydrolase family hydrolase
MPERLRTIDLGPAGAVTVIETPPEGHPSLWRFLYAPGASADVNDPFGAFACRAVARAGISAVRIQFPYQEAGRRTPDRPDTLEATWSAAIDQLSMPGDRLVVGGRSMGGRIASQVVAKGSPVDALALFPTHCTHRVDLNVVATNTYRSSGCPCFSAPALTMPSLHQRS